jgi:hypothetical protein
MFGSILAVGKEVLRTPLCADHEIMRIKSVLVLLSTTLLKGLLCVDPGIERLNFVLVYPPRV